jgi:hypothetical protein
VWSNERVKRAKDSPSTTSIETKDTGMGLGDHSPDDSSDAENGSSSKENAEVGFLFLDECEVFVLSPLSANPNAMNIENRWLDLNFLKEDNNASKPTWTFASEECSHCKVVLRPFHGEPESEGWCLALEGAGPRFDGTIEGSRPDGTLCTCTTRRKQRSDAALILGLALTCQEMGHIHIQNSRIALRDTDATESEAAVEAAIFLSFSIPEMTTSEQTKSNSPTKRRQSSKRRFISDSAKPLPPATQLLLSLMRSDWKSIDVKLRYPEKIWGIQSTRSRMLTRKLPFFPPKISLEEVYQRIGGAPSVLEEAEEVQDISNSTSIGTSGCSLKSLPNDVLIDQISSYLRAGSVEALRRTCKQLHFRLRSVVSGLKLRLHTHQVKSLSWMRLRETKPLVESDFAIEADLTTLGMEHDVHRAATGGASVVLSARTRSSETTDCHDNDIRISQYNGDEIIVRPDDPLTRRFARGGLLCDDPGLGKTITVISLMLQTMGLSTVPPEQNLASTHETDEKMSGEERIFVEYWREQVLGEFRPQVLHKLVNSFLRANRDADIFVHPVDPEIHDCPDYFEVIKHPMCFRDIKRMIDNGGYADSFGAFQEDAELCFR